MNHIIADMLCVAVGGFFGALARYGVSTWANRRFPSVVPRATLFVNLSGSLLLGLLAGGNWGTAVTLLLGTGFMGAYTTFSTFNVENVQLARRKQWSALSLYVGISYIAGIALAFAGHSLGVMLH
jgi:CrcB protein